jgi:hypothetical protein
MGTAALSVRWGRGVEAAAWLALLRARKGLGLVVLYADVGSQHFSIHPIEDQRLENCGPVDYWPVWLFLDFLFPFL